MKLLSVAIPCYNSEAYMEKCIKSILPGGEEVEIIIVDDGSSDGTAAIADRYAEEYPTIIKAVHQENGGHGEAVNAGIRNATGLYFKVVDSDDWLSRDAYLQALSHLEKLAKGSDTVDLFVTNFVYDKQGATRKKVMRFNHCFPQEEIFGWKDMGHLPKGKYLLMHSLIYRTQLLKDCGLSLPKHTFYVDNLVAFTPLMYVKTLYYLNVPLYRYYIGREDQSVNEDIMIKRIDQQLLVTKLMIDSYRPELVKKKNQAEMITHYLSIIMIVSTILLLRIDTEESIKQRKELWDYLKKKDLFLYLRIRHSFLGRMINMPGEAGRKFAVNGYRLTQKFYGFN